MTDTQSPVTRSGLNPITDTPDSQPGAPFLPESTLLTEIKGSFLFYYKSVHCRIVVLTALSFVVLYFLGRMAMNVTNGRWRT